MSARNRELLALVPVALLLTAGFTAFQSALDGFGVEFEQGTHVVVSESTTPESTTARTATSREIRAPARVRARMSRPS